MPNKIITVIGLFLCLTWKVFAQDVADISCDEATYNFGIIYEDKGIVNHDFVIKNTGTMPLVITRVTASCGCTQPKWEKTPIAPGKTSEIKVAYNPKGRPGPFLKTIRIYSNGNKGGYTLVIKGNVETTPELPPISYPYSIGDLKLQTKIILFNNVRLTETVGEKINIVNEGKTEMNLQFGKYPHYLNITASPTKLAPGETGQISVLLDAKVLDKLGHTMAQIPLSIQGTEKKATNGMLTVTANIIDNFSKWSASERKAAPVNQLSSTVVDFGKLPKKDGIFPLISGRVWKTIDITNTGKSPLIIHSISCDNDLVLISGGKRSIKPESTATFKIAVRPREIKARLETLITIVSNDPNGPIRLIKVTAEK